MKHRSKPLLPFALLLALAGLVPEASAQRRAGHATSYGAPVSAVVAGSRASCYAVGIDHRARVVVSSCAPRRVWVPGRYETVEERVWIPEASERVWIEPVYEVRRDYCGRSFRVLVRAGYFEVQCVPAHAEVRLVRVWRPGHWSFA